MRSICRFQIWCLLINALLFAWNIECAIYEKIEEMSKETQQDNTVTWRIILFPDKIPQSFSINKLK